MEGLRLNLVYGLAVYVWVWCGLGRQGCAGEEIIRKKYKLFNSSSSISLSFGKQDWVKTEYQTKVRSLSTL